MIIPQEQRELEVEAVLVALVYVLPEGWEAVNGKSLPEKQQ